MPAPSLATADAGSTRTPLRIDVDKGRLETAGHRARFDPAVEDDALIAYLKLVRRLRDVEREPSFVLRRDDVVILAGALREDAVVILDRLGELMGATVTQRRSMVTAFLAGALLIAVATGATALAPSDGRAPASPTSGERTDVVASAPADRGRVDGAGDRTSTGDAGATSGGSTAGQVGTTAGTAAAASGTAEAGSGPAQAPSGPVGVPTSPSTGAATPPAAGAPQARPGEPRGVSDAPSGDVDRPEPGDGDLGLPQQPGRWRSGPEIVQPGADIDIPNDTPQDGPEVIQPGADIDIPNDEADDDIPVGIPTPPAGEQDLPDPLPLVPPRDATPPVGPPANVTPPVGPPVDVTPPVGPPANVTPPVGPPANVTPPVGPPVDVTPPVGPPQDDTRGNGDGNRGIGRGNGGGNGTANEGNGVGPQR